MKTTEERLMMLEDDLSIRNLVAKFADTATTADYEGFKKLWNIDGIINVHHLASTTAKGIDDIIAWFKKLREDKDFFVQFVHSGVLNIEGNTATGRWLIHEMGQGPGETYYNNYGVFNDTMEKTNGQWLFAERTYDYLWLDTGKFNGQPFKLPKYF